MHIFMFDYDLYKKTRHTTIGGLASYNEFNINEHAINIFLN